MVPTEVFVLACALDQCDDPSAEAISFAYELFERLKGRGYALATMGDQNDD